MVVSRRGRDRVVVADGFDACFRAQFPRLAALGTILTGSREVGADIAQEALLRALRDWQRVSALDSPAPFEPDPSSRPGIGAGAVARLVPHGVDPTASTSFETLSNNGVSVLASSPDGSIYGLNLYTGGWVRIVPGD
jgi:hypothetical protein